LGADLVIAVDVNFDGVRFFDRPRTALGVLMRVFSAVEKIVSNQERDKADLMIAPKVGHIRWDQTRHSRELIKLGYEAGLGAIDQIRNLISERTIADQKMESIAV
jgi:predicted acylesterase/phospholipase RssA